MVTVISSRTAKFAATAAMANCGRTVSNAKRTDENTRIAAITAITAIPVSRSSQIARILSGLHLVRD